MPLRVGFPSSLRLQRHTSVALSRKLLGELPLKRFPPDLPRTPMISQELLNMLRCPLDPGRVTRLEEAAAGLVCQRCRLTFPVREGIPCMLVDEAQLPAGCSRIEELPCQKAPPPATTP